MKEYSLWMALVLAMAVPAIADVGSAVKSSGVKGGLVVHVGCEDGKETAALLVNDSFLVHGLDQDGKNVTEARKHVTSLGLYGKVSISAFDGKRLPYADNLVNLVIVSSADCQVSTDEILRVLAPNGVAIAKGMTSSGVWLPAPGAGDGFVKLTKPWPEEIDDWSHHLQGPDNNAVANDTVVGTPRRLQWACGPLWSRSHEFLSSLCAMVSAGGRLFYILDEGLTSITDAPLPERWRLIARDGFNGVLLWKKPLENWGTRAWRKGALRGTPQTVPRRIVAEENRLFVTLGHSAPVSALDASTGKELAVYDGTENAQEMRYLGGILVARIGGNRLVAVDTQTGTRLWEATGKIQPQMLAASHGKVFYLDGRKVTCRLLKDGNELWQKNPASQGPGVKQLLVHGPHLIVAAGGAIRALEANSGKTVWTVKARVSRDALFVAHGQLWAPGVVGYDLQTGEVRTRIKAPGVNTPGHHLRCYPSKATENFLITPNRGVEFVSLTGGSHAQNDWTRGPCTFGVLPSNGLLYVGPNPCFCYPGVKVTGFNAFAGAPPGQEPEPEARDERSGKDSDRLERGPAYGEAGALAARPQSVEDWPTYRHDGRRSGGASTQVPADVRKRWSAALGGRLTQPVIAGRKVFVASRDTHSVHALAEDSGREVWSFTAGGRIDSPPTVHGGLVLFGCADGSVYCLRASDGETVWRFRAAPRDRWIVSFGQLESPWRVHGSVLVEGGVVYFTAGRSTFLDGGILVFGLDPVTGKVLHETRLDTWSRTRKDAENKPFIPAYHMEGAASDILVSEGGHIYLGQYKFDRSLETQSVPYLLPDTGSETGAMGRTELTGKPFVQDMKRMGQDETVQRDWQLRQWPKMAQEHKEKYGGSNLGERKMGRHVLATGGFLDDSWFNRTFWMYSEIWPGFYIAHRGAKTGQLLSVGDEKTYAVQAFPSRNLQSPLFKAGEEGYLLFADDNDNEPVLPAYTRGVPKGIGFTRKEPPVWFQWVPVRIRAMVVTGNALLVVGPPDVLDPDDPMAAFEGRKGGLLWAVSKETGEKLSEHELPSPPIFDGMSAAGGRLYVSTMDGHLICLGK